MIDEFHGIECASPARRFRRDRRDRRSPDRRPSANTPAGILRSRARSIERLERWLRKSLSVPEMEVGWTHGDFHLGNVLIDDRDDRIVGVVDWGRAESDGLTVLDGSRSFSWNEPRAREEEIGTLVLALLNDVQLAPADRARSAVLAELRRLAAT